MADPPYSSIQFNNFHSSNALSKYVKVVYKSGLRQHGGVLSTRSFSPRPVLPQLRSLLNRAKRLDNDD